MAKINFKFDKRKAEANFRQTFDRTLDNKQMQREVGLFLVKRIRQFARSRKPMSKTRKLPNLSDKWKKRRGKLSKVNPTHKTYSQNRSNITFTGELLNSIAFKYNRKSGFTIFPKGMHKGYIGLKGKRGKSVSNADIVKGLDKLGYKFMTEIDKQGIKRIKALYIRFLRRELRK